jgi:hypothetical protein
MSLKDRVEKIVGYRVAYTDDFSDRDYNRIMRQLMLRLVDVEEMFPGEYDYYEDVKEEYLPDFLKCEEDRDYSYSVETSRGGGYKLVVTDWSTDYRRDTGIKIPSFILEENWYNDVESQRISRRINEIDKEINRIETIMASGTGQIMMLNKEKSDLEYKLQDLKK